MKSDGSVVINTEINTSGTKAGVKEIQAILKELIHSTKTLNTTMVNAFAAIGSGAMQAAGSVSEISASAKDAEHGIAAVDKQMSSLGNHKIPTQEYAEVTKAVEKAQRALDRLLERKQKMDSVGADQEARSYKNLQYDIEEARNSLQAMKADQQDLIDEGAAFVNQIADATREAEALQHQMDAITFKDNNQPPPPSIHDTGDYDIFGNAVDLSISKVRELGDVSNQSLKQIEDKTEESTKSTNAWRNAWDLFLNSFKHFPQNIKTGFGSFRNALAGSANKLGTVQDEVDRYTNALRQAEKAGHGLGDIPYDQAYKGLARAKNNANEYRKALEDTNRTQKKIKKSTDSMNRSMKKTSDIANPLSKSIFKLGNMFKLMIVRMAMRQVMSGMREGFQNLAVYSEDVNRSISAVISSLTMFKNSAAAAFSPILNVVSPILTNFIRQLAEANNWVSQLFAAMAGKNTYIKAVEVQEDYAVGLDKTNDALKEEQKQLKKVTYSFDDLIQRQADSNDVNKEDGYKGPNPADMFETAEIENDVKSMADAVKKVLTDLFLPIQQSWNNHGSYAVAAAKNAFHSLKALAKDVGASFLQVWKDEGYGEKITSNLIITFGNLAQTIANLAERFRVAWNEGDRGTSILRHIADIILTISEVFKKASEEIKNWSAQLNFSPLLKSFDNVLVRLNPVVRKVGELLLWLLSNVLLPFSKWALEKAIPAVLDVIAGGLAFLASVIDALQPVALWLWEAFLKPFGEWAGDVVIKALKTVADTLTRISEWIKENRPFIENVTTAVLGFFAAWKIISFVSGIANLIKSLGGFIDIARAVIGIITKTVMSISPLKIVIAAIIALIAILAKNWDAMTPKERVISALLAAAAAAAALAVALNAVGGPVAAGLVALAIGAGVASAVIAINAGQRQVASSSAGGSAAFSAGSAPPYATVPFRVPALATGTVVPPRAEFLALLGDNKHEPEIVSPISTIEQAVRNVVSEDENNNRTIQIDLILDGTRFGRAVYKYGREERQRIGLRMVDN